jgi:hypothetical protein
VTRRVALRRLDVDPRRSVDPPRSPILVPPADALLALPHPLPARWADGRGVAAEDGTRWSLDAAGQVVRLDGTGATAAPHGTPGAPADG